jgi:hypothetical protein
MRVMTQSPAQHYRLNAAAVNTLGATERYEYGYDIEPVLQISLPPARADAIGYDFANGYSGAKKLCFRQRISILFSS